MNTKTTITVVLIALALAVYVVVFETERFGLRGETTRERERQHASASSESGRLLLDEDTLALPLVSTLHITRGDRTPAVLTRRDDNPGAWQQTEPVRFPLDADAVADLINAAQQLRHTSTVTADDADNTLESLGLDPPRGRVAFETRDGERITLTLGRRTAAGRAYLALDEPTIGSRVYVVGDALHDAVLEQPVREMRTRSLADFSFGNVRRVQLNTRDHDPVELTQQGGEWRFDQPEGGRVNVHAARQLITTLTEARVDQFVEDQPASLQPFGLDEPRAVLQVEVVETVDTSDQGLVESTRARTLTVGSPRDLADTGYFAMLDNEPVIFTLDRQTVDQLSVTVDDLRDRRLTPVSRSDVRRITLDRADQPTLTLVRTGAGRAWRFADDGPGFELDQPRMDDLLNAIFQTRAHAFVNAADVSDPLLATLTMTIPQQSEAEVVRIHGSPGDENVRIIRRDEPVAAVVDRDDISLLLAEPIALRDRVLLELRDEQVASVTIDRTGDHPARYEIGRDGREGAADEPGPWNYAGYNRARVRRVFSQLVPLQIQQWTGDAQSPTGDFITVTLNLRDGSRRELTIDPRTRLSRLDDETNAFHVKQALIDALTAELRDTLVLDLEIDDIATVAVADGPTVHRDSAGLFQLDGDGRLDEAAAARLWEALAGLRAVYYYLPGDTLPTDPARTLHLTTRDGARHTITLAPDDAAETAPLVRVDDQLITLESDIAATLRHSLTRE